MRQINSIVIHCSATRPSQDIGAEEIRRWHVEGNGWSDIGYHFVIRRGGQVELGRDLDRPGAHVAGHNSDSIGICLVGGVDDDAKPEENFTTDQWVELSEPVCEMTEKYPEAEVLGHRDFPGVNKACPCFDVRKWWARNE